MIIAGGGGLAMRQNEHVTVLLGSIDGTLTDGLADEDAAGIVAGIQELAKIASLISDDGPYVPRVLASFGQAVNYLRRHASLAELESALAACGQAADETAGRLVKAAFLAATGNLLAAKAEQTRQPSDLDAAAAAFEQAIVTLPEANLIMPVYRHRLAELRQMRANLTATSAPAGMAQSPDPAAGAAAAPSGQPGRTGHQDRILTPDEAESLSALLDPMTGDRIPAAVLRSRKFRWAQRGLLLLALACSAVLAYVWLHGATFLSTDDAIVMTVGFWLTYLAARLGLVYRGPG
jgi:hypothetical protein